MKADGGVGTGSLVPLFLSFVSAFLHVGFVVVVKCLFLPLGDS